MDTVIYMKNKNICKFISEPSFEKLETHNFIYETDTSAMSKESKLSTHRAFLIKSGCGSLIIDGKEIKFEPGCLIIAFKNEEYKVSAGDNCEYMYISFGGSRSDTLFHRFGICKSNRFFKSFDGLIPLWHDSVSRASGKNIDLASESILLYTFSRLDSEKDEKNSLVKQIIEITEECFSSPEHSITSIAKELNYNPKYLSHIFKKQMVVSYSEYLRNYRINYAVSLLNHGIDSVKNIAFLSGFSDPLYFSNVFKKVMGISPKDYKSRNNN